VIKVDVNRILVRSIKGSSEDIANIVLANFVPQYHFSFDVVMRYVAGSRSTVDAWKSYSSKVRHRKYIRKYEIEIEGEECDFISSSKSIINEFPSLIGFGKNIAIIIDYRLTLGLSNLKRYYGPYKNVNRDLVHSVENDVEQIDNKMPKYGLLGFGPHGLFAIRTDNRERMLREEFEDLFRGSIMDKKFMEAIRELDKEFSDDWRVSLYVHFPSELEASVFGDELYKAFEDLSRELRIIEISWEKKSLRDLASAYNVVVALTTDPLTLLPMGKELKEIVEKESENVDIELPASFRGKTLIERHLKNTVGRVFMVYYAGLYLNLTRDYYERLYKQVKKIGDLHSNGRYIGNNDYQKACKTPILALAIDESFEQINVRKFDDVLPVVRRSKRRGSLKTLYFEILGPDVTVTAYDIIIEFLKKLPLYIWPYDNVCPYDNVPVLTAGGEKPIPAYDLIKYAKEVLKEVLIEYAKEVVRSRIRAHRAYCRMVGSCEPYRLDRLDDS